MADDFHQTLAHIDQAVVSSAGAHIGFGAGLDDFLRVPGLGAGGAAIADDPDSAVVGRVGLVAFSPQLFGPVGGHGILAMVDKDELRLFVKGVQPGGQAVLVGVAGKPAQLPDARLDLHRLAKQLDFLRAVDQRVAQRAGALVAHEQHGALRPPKVIL